MARMKKIDMLINMSIRNHHFGDTKETGIVIDVGGKRNEELLCYNPWFYDEYCRYIGEKLSKATTSTVYLRKG